MMEGSEVKKFLKGTNLKVRNPFCDLSRKQQESVHLAGSLLNLYKQQGNH